MSKYKKGDMFVVEITDNNCKVGLVNVISLIPKALAISYIKTRLLFAYVLISIFAINPPPFLRYQHLFVLLITNNII